MELSKEQVKKIIKAIGNEIADKRKQLGMTQPELAKVMGIAVNTIGNIERGEHPGYIDKIIMLCYYLDISVDPLIMGIKDYDMPISSKEFSEYKDGFDKLTPEAKKVVLKTTMTLVKELADYDRHK